MRVYCAPHSPAMLSSCQLEERDLDGHAVGQVLGLLACPAADCADGARPNRPRCEGDPAATRRTVIQWKAGLCPKEAALRWKS
jgi:hypothetical protein